MRLALIEDNEMLARGVARALRDQGHTVDRAGDGATGHALLVSEPVDLAIIDIGLPGISGLEMIRDLRQRRRMLPILVLTAMGETRDRVAGLDAGADDYLAKPFEMAELLARVRALLRRRPALAPDEERVGDLRFDRRGRRLFAGDAEIALSRRELMLFECLVDRLGQILSREAILGSVYGVTAEVEPNAIEILVSRLRKRLKGTGATIRTARGLGYMLDER